MSSADFEEAFAQKPPPGDGGGRGRRGSGRPAPNPAKIFFWLIIGMLGLMAILITASGQGGFAEIEDTQVAVLVNYMTGEAELVTQPGYRIFIPFVERAFLFDKSPQKFFMKGDRNLDNNHVSKLTVRANDGSNFWFEEIEIQYELVPADAAHVLGDSGAGDQFKVHWVRAFARSILRDEFGRFSAAEVADPTVYKGATILATDRMNALLNPHGVKIIQIITPKPRFDAGYEKAIEDRKVADQEVERIKARAMQLTQERDRRLAQIDAMKAVEFADLKGTLEANRIDAERERVRIEKTADAYAKTVTTQGEARKLALVEEARGLTEKAHNEAEGLAAIIAALEQRGEVLVRERLAQRLGQIEFNLVPYTRDTAPDRVELSGDGADLIGNGGGR